MGLLYIFTFGGFLLGWISDFFTLPHQVQMANFLLQHQQERAEFHCTPRAGAGEAFPLYPARR